MSISLIIEIIHCIIRNQVHVQTRRLDKAKFATSYQGIISEFIYFLGDTV
jgi:hypothetical protein